ncbi:LysM peptidoglycan-binding domain-containing protein [Bacillus cereus group sp. TH152-1LC]|uniref:LysM peptidoglycan-binding domain-containing protein n=1 Tax=Bacillus cereus group sp. TH152-1LC TaxID=3018060 RepID=UPI0022E0B081|nr:SH3 domain-containing protein [Bacillus cereus group sp. TH152-1LC]MDA1674859.1 SH3 domain-containing protein [Bacillus cereus group sp. TH152-1LC]
MTMTMTNQIIDENGKLLVSRKETHAVKEVKVKAETKQNTSIKTPVSFETPGYTTRMEKRELKNNGLNFELDLRNVINVLNFKSILESIKENFTAYARKVRSKINGSPVKSVLVTGLFTVLLSLLANNASACVPEYNYQVKGSDNIQTIANNHGVTAEQIKSANGLSSDSLSGVTNVLLPKVSQKTVAVSSLNVRAQAGTDSEIIGHLKKGNKVFVSFQKDGWSGIMYDGRLAYVSSELLSENSAGSKETTKPVSKPTGNQTVSTPSQTKEMYVNTLSLRVRAEQSKSSQILGYLKKGEKINVIKNHYGWAEISYNGKTAYVGMDLLSETKPAPSTTTSVESKETTKPVSKPTENQTVSTPSQTKEMYVDTLTLRARAEKSKSSAILGYLKKGEKVNVIKNHFGWAEISFNGKTAYVGMEFLSEKAPTTSTSTSVSKETKPVAKETKPVSKPNEDQALLNTGIYETKKGDTLQSISQRSGISIEDLKGFNPGLKPVIYPGAILVIPPKGQHKFDGTVVSFADNHTVIFNINGKQVAFEVSDINKFKKGEKWDLTAKDSKGNMVLISGEPLNY